MWKKIGVGVLAFLAICSAGYVISDEDLMAAEEDIRLGAFEYTFGAPAVYYTFGDLAGDGYSVSNAYFKMINRIGDKVILKASTYASKLDAKGATSVAMDNAIYEKTAVKKAIDVMNNRLDEFEKKVVIPNDLGEYLRLPTVSDFFDTSITGCELTVPSSSATFPVKCLKYRDDTNVQYKMTDVGTSGFQGWFRDLSPRDNNSYFISETPTTYGLRTKAIGATYTARISPVVEIDSTKVNLILNKNVLPTNYRTKMKVYTKVASPNSFGIRDETLTLTTSPNLVKEPNGFKFQYEFSRPTNTTINENFNMTYLLKKQGDTDPNNFAYYGGIQKDSDGVTGRVDFDTIIPDTGTYDMYVYTWVGYNGVGHNSPRISNIVKYEGIKIGIPEFIQTPEKDITYYESKFNSLTDNTIGEIKKADTTMTGVNYTLASHPDHTSDAHANDYTNFKFEEYTDKTKDILKASKDLSPGFYYFQVVKLKSDGTTDPSLTIDCEITVYPSRETLKFNANKKTVDGVESNYTSDDINNATGSDIVIGTTSLDPAVNQDFGEITYGFKNAKLNGSAVTAGNEDFKMDAKTGKIIKNNKISFGKHEFTSTVTFTKDETSITLEKGTHSFFINPIIYFVDPKTPTTKITKMDVIYDEEATDHTFTVMAKSDENAVTTGMKYRLKKDDTSNILSYSGSGAKFTALKPGTTTIEAYYQDSGVDVVVCELSVKVAAKPISNLSYTFTPQKDSANVSYTFLAYQKNATRDTQVGYISSKNGAKPITYKLSDTVNFTLKANTDEATKATQPYQTDASGNVCIYANKDLGIGAYNLVIQAYDVMQEPYWSTEGNNTHYGIDKDDNKVSSYPYGRISDTYEIVVYPNESQISVTQNKKTDGNYYTDIELNKDTTIKIGSVEFASSAMIQELNAKGYVIDSATIVNKGSTTSHSEFMLEVDPVNKGKFYIKGKGNVSSGKKEFDIIVKFKKNGTTDITATITKADQSILIASDLQFADPAQPTEFLDKDTYVKYYDPENKTNDVTIIATDNKQANITNAKVKYCILDKDVCTNTSDVIELVDDGYGSAKIKALAPGTTKKSVNIQAYMEGENNTILVKKSLTIEVYPALQMLSWEGTNIQASENHIVRDDTQDRTWNLSIKYDKDNPDPQTFVMEEVIKGSAKKDNIITLRDDVVEGTTPSIQYDVKYQDISDMDKVRMENGTLKVLGEVKGKITITATAEATGNYMAAGFDDASTPDVNENCSAKLVVSIFNKAKVDFTKSYGKNPGATSDEALGKAPLGELSIDPVTETDYRFVIDTIKQKDEKASTIENEVFVEIDASKLSVKVENGKTMLYANTTSPLGAGTYLVNVKANKNKEEATPKEIRIVIGNDAMDVEKLKWQSKLSDTFIDMKGTIDKESNTNTETLQHRYAENGEFFVRVENTLSETQLENATITYALSQDSASDVIEIAANGRITMLNASQDDTILSVKATIKKDGYETCYVYLPILIEKGDPTLQLINKNGTAYPLTNVNDKTKYNALELVYEEGGRVDVFTKGVPKDTNVTIELFDKGASKGNDVLAFKEVDTNSFLCEITKDEYATQRLSKCELSIKNALFDQLRDRNKIVYRASIEESKNYKAMSIEMPINVAPAQQSDFDFAEGELFYESNQDGLIEPVFRRKNGTYKNISTGKITLLTSINGGEPDFQEDEVWLDDSDYNPEDPDYTDGIQAFGYNIVVAEEEEEERVGTLYAQKEKDRNFVVSEIKALKVHIVPEGSCQYQVTIKNYPTLSSSPTKDITYGDAYFSISAKSEIEDSADPGATYSFEIDESAKDYLTTYGTNGNEFSPIKAGTKIKIKITRTSGTGISSKPVTKSITIKPKEVRLKVNDIQKKNGMSLHEDEFGFTAESGAFLASDKDLLEITYIAQDRDGTSLTTLSDGIRMMHNQIPLKATIANKDVNNDILANYKVVNMDGKTIGIEDGCLTITEDESSESWYEIKEGTNLESIVTKKGMNDWYNGPLSIVLKPEAGSYDLMSNDEKQWAIDPISYEKEGTNDIQVYFRQSSGSEIGAIAKPQIKKVKIDATKPTITSIKASLTHQDTFSKLIRALSFQSFMKPGEEVTISSADVQNLKDTEISTTNNIPEGITYQVFALDEDGNRTDPVIENQKLTTDQKGIGRFVLEEPGSYEVCANVRDQAGNISDVVCEPLLVKKIDVDVDGDGTNDFIDSNDDGCPDLDIVLSNKENKQYKINVDRDGDGIPDLNIDSDGDGIAEINVDSDGDKKPDLNLVILSKWEPSTCVVGQSDQYCTMQDIKPLINVDINDDQIPEINIDTKGDFKAHYNIARPGEDKPYMNIGKVHTTWKPDQNYKKDAFIFDSIAYHKPLLNIDTDDDGYPDVNLDFDGNGEPEINVDMNGDLIPDINIDGDGDGKPDYNLDPDENGNPTKNVIPIDSWVPNLNGALDGLAFDTMEIKKKDNLEDQGVTVERPGGSFLPNFSIKVENIKDSASSELREGIGEFVTTDMEIKDILDVKLFYGDKQVQPDEAFKIKLPMKEEWNLLKNMKVIVEQEDGSFKEMEFTIENNHIVYESKYLGKVSVIGDMVKEEEVVKPDPKPETPDIEIKPSTEDKTTPKKEVKGEYYGGAITGDSVHMEGWVMMVGCSALVLGFLGCRETFKKSKK